MPKTYQEYVKACRANNKLPCGEQVWRMIATADVMQAQRVPQDGRHLRTPDGTWVKG